VIEGPPRTTEVTRSALLAADVVLIPVQPSPYDVWACAQLVALVKECSVFKEHQKSAFLINRKIVNTAIGRDVGDALAAYALPVLQTAIAQRVAFAEAAATGQTVLERRPTGISDSRYWRVCVMTKLVRKTKCKLAPGCRWASHSHTTEEIAMARGRKSLRSSSPEERQTLNGGNDRPL
jgi:hypothetical protein